MAGSTRAVRQQRYQSIRALTQQLISGLTAEDCQAQSMPDASPVKWHLAHTSWFFETFVLVPHWPGYCVFDARYRDLFNSYYNTVGPQPVRGERGLVTRPDFATVQQYRSHVDAAVAALLNQESITAELGALVDLGLQHEQQHQELILTDLQHLFWCNPLAPTYAEPASHSVATITAAPTHPVIKNPAHFLTFSGGLQMVGAEVSSGRFAFDNELPRHQVWLAPFELSNRLVTNAEYQQFIDDGGYRNPDLWLSLGWATVQQENWQAPLYWRRSNAGWQRFSLHGEQAIEPDAPVPHFDLSSFLLRGVRPRCGMAGGEGWRSRLPDAG